MSKYCDIAIGHPLHGPYHDTEYGFPMADERQLFELQSLELFQAGLSWALILKKRPTIVAAFDGFDVDRVAAYGDGDVARLLADPGIIRNRLKVNAIIDNAQAIAALRDSHGGFAEWIATHHPLGRGGWTKLFQKAFKFMGPEIVNEFIMCIGYLPGAHREDCPVFKLIAGLHPPWLETGVDFYKKHE